MHRYMELKQVNNEKKPAFFLGNFLMRLFLTSLE